MAGHFVQPSPPVNPDATLSFDGLSAMMYQVEEWNTHDPSTLDNFVPVTVAGLGSTSTVSYVRDIKTGAGIGSARYVSGILGQSLPVGNIVFVARITDIVAGAGVDRYTVLGMKFNFTTFDNSNIAAFEQIADDTWQCNTEGTTTVITALSNNDTVMIIIRGTITKYYVNNSLVATHTTVPTFPVRFGASVIGTAATVVSGREIGIVHMNFKRYGK